MGIETAESKVARENFNKALEILSTEKINDIYLLAIALSAEAERAAFISGVKLGVQLMMETKCHYIVLTKPTLGDTIMVR